MKAERSITLLLSGFILLMMTACGSENGADHHTTDVPPDSFDASEPIPEPPPEPTQHQVNLHEFLDNPLDFHAYKKVNRYMLNCGYSPDTLFRPDTTGFYYNYCLFNASARPNEDYPDAERPSAEYRSDLESGDPLLEFTVYMYGKKIGYYSNDNELLVFFRSRTTDPALGQANLVGQDSTEIMARFGQPYQRRDAAAAYWIADKLLLLKYRKGKVRFFQYKHLNFGLGENDSLPDPLWAWPGWE